ncbi:MAG: hypothetical protein NUV67_01380 [archaeon]|nr:hypothetical protein [archaeon]
MPGLFSGGGRKYRKFFDENKGAREMENWDARQADIAHGKEILGRGKYVQNESLIKRLETAAIGAQVTSKVPAGVPHNFKKIQSRKFPDLPVVVEQAIDGANFHAIKAYVRNEKGVWLDISADYF